MHDVRALKRALEYLKQAARRNRSGPQPGRDRRQARRYNYLAEGSGTLLQRGGSEVIVHLEKDFPILATSLSGSGASFLANYLLQNEDQLELRLPETGGAVKKLLARVVYAKRVGLNAYEIGAEFTGVRKGKSSARAASAKTP